MKKSMFSLLLAALALTNCSKDEEAVVTPVVDQPAYTIYATPDSRTTNDGMNTKWEADDEVNVFHAATGSTEYVAAEGAFATAAGDGVFSGNLKAALTEEAYDWYMFYPYNSYTTTPANTDGGRSYIGCRSDQAQTQTGNNSMAHIAGTNYPLYGKATNVAAATTPSITMKHASSLVEFKVVNGTSEAFAVTGIDFTSTEDIVGNYYIDFSSATPSFKKYSTYTSSLAQLVVAEGAEIAAGGSATFYMAIKPHTVDGDIHIVVKTTQGNCEKTITGQTPTFTAGKMKTITVNVASFKTAYAIPYEDDLSWLANLDNNTSTALTPADLDEHYANCSTVYKDGTALKLGTSSVTGSITTNHFDLDEPFVVVVTAKTYSTDVSKISVLVDGETSTEYALYDKYTTYAFPFTAKTDASQVTVQIGGKRGYISAFAIQKSGYAVAPAIRVTSGNTISVDDAAVTDKELTFDVINAVQGKSVTASTTDTWITLGSPTDSKVTYSIDANTGTTPREGTITLKYEGAEDVLVAVKQTAPVTGTQVVFNFDDLLDYSTATEVESVSISPLTISFAKGGYTSLPKYKESNGYLQFYSKNEMTLSGGTIVKVQIAYSGSIAFHDKIEFDSGSYAGTAAQGTWTGSSTNLKITNKHTAQATITQITVWYN